VCSSVTDAQATVLCAAVYGSEGFTLRAVLMRRSSVAHPVHVPCLRVGVVKGGMKL
jgi:hypothetical protein